MPYIRNTNLKNRKANERLEREDKNAGSSQVHGNASAGVGAAAPASTTPSSNNQSEIGNATVNANVSTETPTSPTPSAPKKKNTENAGLRGGLRDQLKKEAGIVSKLPEDFPIDRWESLNTKQQRHALKFSGLDDKEQWVLLNASAPLSVLDELNQAQNQAAMRAHITALFSPMASPARQRETASDSLRPYSTSL